jgi:hypothetical protein
MQLEQLVSPAPDDHDIREEGAKRLDPSPEVGRDSITGPDHPLVLSRSARPSAGPRLRPHRTSACSAPLAEC